MNDYTGRNGYVALPLILALAACAGPKWSKPGGTQQDWYRDKSECEAQAGAGNTGYRTPMEPCRTF